MSVGGVSREQPFFFCSLLFFISLSPFFVLFLHTGADNNLKGDIMGAAWGVRGRLRLNGKDGVAHVSRKKGRCNQNKHKKSILKGLDHASWVCTQKVVMVTLSLSVFRSPSLLLFSHTLFCSLSQTDIDKRIHTYIHIHIYTSAPSRLLFLILKGIWAFVPIHTAQRNVHSEGVDK